MIAADYDKLARIHYPSDAVQLEHAIRRLAQDGLAARDIAGALRLDLAVVTAALPPSPTAANLTPASTSSAPAPAAAAGDSHHRFTTEE